jgi:uncharacterized protein
MAVLTEDMKRVVREQRTGYVATASPDGNPNLSPKGTLTVWDDDHLVFADLRSPRTIANLRANPRVEVNVVDPIARKGYRFRGTAVVHADGPEFDAVVAFYERDYRIERARIQHVVLIAVEKAAPVVSPSYDMGATEEQVRARWRRRLLSER